MRYEAPGSLNRHIAASAGRGVITRVTPPGPVRAVPRRPVAALQFRSQQADGGTDETLIDSIMVR